MTRPALLAALFLGLIPMLAPVAALAQACGKSPVAISCPDGHVWDAAAMLCMPPST